MSECGKFRQESLPSAKRRCFRVQSKRPERNLEDKPETQWKAGVFLGSLVTLETLMNTFCGTFGQRPSPRAELVVLLQHDSLSWRLRSRSLRYAWRALRIFPRCKDETAVDKSGAAMSILK